MRGCKQRRRWNDATPGSNGHRQCGYGRLSRSLPPETTSLKHERTIADLDDDKNDILAEIHGNVYEFLITAIIS